MPQLRIRSTVGSRAKCEMRVITHHSVAEQIVGEEFEQFRQLLHDPFLAILVGAAADGTQPAQKSPSYAD